MNLYVYKHDRCRDVAMRVIGSSRRAGGYRCIVRWINVVSPTHHFYCTDKLDVVFVKDADVPMWRPFDAAV